MRFVKFMMVQAGEVYINPENVEAVMEAKNTVAICMVSGEVLYVEGTLALVTSKLELSKSDAVDRWAEERKEAAT